MASEAKEKVYINEGKKQTPGNDTEFCNAMIGYGANKSLIKKLAAAGFDNIKLISAIQTTEDIKEVVEGCKLNLQEKFNLKAVINELSNKQSVVDPEELNAVDSMKIKLEALDISIDLIAETIKRIENEADAHSKRVKETFDRIRSCLKEREDELVNKLHSIATVKKLKLAKLANGVQGQCVAVKTIIETSQKMIKEPIDVTNVSSIKARKEKIFKMTQEVNEIKAINKEDSVITNNTITVHLDEKKIFEFVSNFGDVTSSLLPILISLKDNGKNKAVIHWKVNGTKPEKSKPYKLRFECLQIQSLDHKLNDDEKEQWQQNVVQRDEINEINEQEFDVKFDADIAFFAFRFRVFDQMRNEWSLPSNAMSIQMKNNYKLPQGLNGSILINDDYLEKMLMEHVLLSTLKNQKFELLLRGSVHGLSIKAFNEYCQNKGSVLVIVQSKEYERTFGGFTKIGFKKGINNYQRDDDAFLFYIDPKTNKAQRFPVKNAEYAIYSHNNYGVCFGNYDLYWDSYGKGYCARKYFDYFVATDKTPLSGGASGWTVSDYEVWGIAVSGNAK